MPAHSRSWGFRGGLPPGVLTIASAIKQAIGRLPSPFRGEAIFFCVGLMRGLLCWVTICQTFGASGFSAICSGFYGLPVASLGYLVGLAWVVGFRPLGLRSSLFDIGSHP
jgi:hypothetical protein